MEQLLRRANEQNPRSRIHSGLIWAYYCPSSEDLPLGNMLREKPLNGCGLEYMHGCSVAGFQEIASYGCYMSEVP